MGVAVEGNHPYDERKHTHGGRFVMIAVILGLMERDAYVSKVPRSK
jgi:hypothetical protein